MTYPAAVAAAAQEFAPGAAVDLFTLDLNPIGVATVYYFTPTNLAGVEIVWNSQTYTYAAISLSDLEWSADGDPPNPKLLLPNGSKFTAALVTQYEDLVGVKVTRTRTFQRFLDGQPDADVNAYLSLDTFRIEQKTALNKVFAEFSIRPVHSMEHRNLPGRVCLKNTCQHRYRVWTGSAFDYTNATCPYTEEGTGNVFDRDGNAATNATDVCGKTLADCQLRYNDPAETVPIFAFPGMARIRTR